MTVYYVIRRVDRASVQRRTLNERNTWQMRSHSLHASLHAEHRLLSNNTAVRKSSSGNNQINIYSRFSKNGRLKKKSFLHTLIQAVFRFINKLLLSLRPPSMHKKSRRRSDGGYNECAHRCLIKLMQRMCYRLFIYTPSRHSSTLDLCLRPSNKSKANIQLCAPKMKSIDAHTRN